MVIEIEDGRDERVAPSLDVCDASVGGGVMEPDDLRIILIAVAIAAFAFALVFILDHVGAPF
jgi:hypothetical protein